MVEKGEPRGNTSSSIIVRPASPATSLFIGIFWGNCAGDRRWPKDLSLRAEAVVERGLKNLRLYIDARDSRV